MWLVNIEENQPIKQWQNKCDWLNIQENQPIKTNLEER